MPDSSIRLSFNDFRSISMRYSLSRSQRVALSKVILSYERSEADTKILLAERDSSVSYLNRLRTEDLASFSLQLESLGEENARLGKRPTRLKLVLYALASLATGYTVGRSEIVQLLLRSR